MLFLFFKFFKGKKLREGYYYVVKIYNIVGGMTNTNQWAQFIANTPLIKLAYSCSSVSIINNSLCHAKVTYKLTARNASIADFNEFHKPIYNVSLQR